jgi:hypothetical protein
MTRARYALTLLLAALGASLTVTSSATCQIGTDFNHYGPCYHEACPFVDGYIETDEEVTELTQTDSLTDSADLRGRAVVAVLDDPVAIPASETTAMASDGTMEATGAAPSATAAVAEPAEADMRSSSSPVASTNSADEVTDVYNYGYRYEYMSRHGYYGQRYPEYEQAAASSSWAAAPTTPATEPVADSTATCHKPYDVYDYVHHYDRAYDAGCCPAGAPSAAAEMTWSVAAGAQPEVVQDCENDVYQAYLQRCAEEAVAKALTIEATRPVTESPAYEPYGYEYRHQTQSPATTAASQTIVTAMEPEPTSESNEQYAPYEPYDAVPDTAPAYEVYDYDNGYEPSVSNQPSAPHEPAAVEQPAAMEPAAVLEPQPAGTEESSPYDAASYGRHPYGYGYEYDYEYHKAYGSYGQTDAASPAPRPQADAQSDVDAQQLIESGREVLNAIVELELVAAARAEAEQWYADAAHAVTSIDFDRLRREATEALAAALQQSAASSEWNEADVYVFTFDSDLNAEPVAASEVEQTPWMVEDQVVQPSREDGATPALVAPASDNAVATYLPLDRDQVLQWSRNAIASASAAWERLIIALQRVADRSVATVPVDDPTSTHR